MPKLDLALEENGPKTLHFEWGFTWSKLKATLDGREVMAFAKKADLEAGRAVTLPDGSTLAVRLTKNVFAPELEVLRNGHPLPGSPTHPHARVKQGGIALLLIGLFTGISAGAQASIGDGGVAAAIGVLVEAALFAGLGLLTMKRKQRWAVIAGTGLYALESAFTLFSVVSAGSAGAVGGLAGFVIWRVLLFTLLGRAILAFRDLDRLDPNTTVAVFR